MDTNYQLGNLGRYFFRTGDELISLEAYERNFVKEHLPAQLSQVKGSKAPSIRAYDKDPEKRVTPEEFVVVEIVHLEGTGDVTWEVGSQFI